MLCFTLPLCSFWLLSCLMVLIMYDNITLHHIVCICVVRVCFAKPQNNTGYMKNGSARPNVVKELRISFIMVSLHIYLFEVFSYPFICCEHNAWVVFGCFFPDSYSESRSYSYQILNTHTDTRTHKQTRWKQRCARRRQLVSERMCFSNELLLLLVLFCFQQCFHVMFGLFVLQPMDFIFCFHISFIKNLYSTMCVYRTQVYWEGREESDRMEKRWNQCSLEAKIAKPMFALRDFRNFFCSFTTPFQFFFFLEFLYYTLYITVKSMSTTLARANDGIARNDWGKRSVVNVSKHGIYVCHKIHTHIHTHTLSQI